MKKNISKILALVLVLCLLPCWSGIAFAAPETANGVEKSVPSADDSSSGGPGPAIAAAAYDGGTLNVGTESSPGDATAEKTGGASSSGQAIGALAYTNTGNTSTVNVSGNASASSNASKNEGVSNSAEGAAAHAAGSGSSSVVNVGGDVKASSTGTGDALGVEAITQGLSTGTNSATVSVGGNVKADSNGSGDAYAVGGVSSNSGDITVNITGDASAQVGKEGSGDAYGIWANNKNGGNVTVTTGDLEAENKGSGTAAGVFVSSNGGITNITAGDVEAEAEKSNLSGTTDSVGIEVQAEQNATVSIEVDEVESEAEVGAADGIHVVSKGDSEVTVDAKGPVTVTGQEYAQGAFLLLKDNAKVSMNVGDDLTTEGSASVGLVLVIDDNGEASIVVDGDMKSEGAGIQLSGQGGLADVEIYGDLDAESTGIYDRGKTEASFLVDGTIHGDEIGILIDSIATIDNLEVTVWQIDKNTVDGEEHVAASSTSDDHKAVTESSKQLEQSINYIIKIKPSQADLISLVGTETKNFSKESYEVAHMGDKVAMKITVPDGYRLTGAYGDKFEKLPLKMDDNGNYYVIVPMGGGVYLSAVFDKINYGPEPVAFDYDPHAPKLNYVTVTFDLNEGHTLSGNPGPVEKTVPVGSWIRLLEAPSKDGSTFELWYTEDESVQVSAPFDSFQVMHDIVFIAKWVGEEIAYTPTEEETALVESVSALSLIPVEMQTASEEDVVAEEPAPAEEASIDPADNEVPAEAGQTVAAEAVEEPAVPAPAASVPDDAAMMEQFTEALANMNAAAAEMHAAAAEMRAAAAEMRTSAPDGALQALSGDSLDTPDDMTAPGKEPAPSLIVATEPESPGQGISLPATLTIEVNGKTIELPVNVKISLSNLAA